MTEEQLSALLRLKRHEQPPPGYFDGLLRDVHRRQRAELIQRPLWRIALERLQCFFGEPTMAPVSYAGALAAVLVVGVATISSMEPQPLGGGSAAIASFDFPPQPAKAPAHTLTLEPRQESLITQQPFESFPGQSTHTPRYVIDARPVSYDVSFSF